MAKRKRYQLTEAQLKPVIRYINENYPAGVTDYNIDRLSGADRDYYTAITGVEFDLQAYDLIFDVETDQGQILTKKLYLGDDNLINYVENELVKSGIPKDVEWEVKAAFLKNHQVVLRIDVNDQMYDVPIHPDYIMDWLPEIDSDEEHPTFEPDPDEAGDRDREE